MEVRQGNYIDGEWVASSGDAVKVVVNPFTQEPMGSAPVATAQDVHLAVRSARRALDSGWPDTSLDARIAIVERIREGLLAHSEVLARLAARCMGSPITSARNLGNAAELIDMYIEMARRIRFEYVRSDFTGDTLIARRPVGVVGAIVPWNVPVRSEVKKVIPALLMGCTVVLKPAPETPFGAALLAEICSEAGLPDGVLNLVLGDGTTGRWLVDHPDVRKIAFTGSTAVGSEIWAAAAPTLKRLQLELGGKSAAIILDDADLDSAIPWCSKGIFEGSGQQCTATSRILAPRHRYDEVVERMRHAARAYVMGDPLDIDTTLGPVVSQRQQERVLNYIRLGVDEGATVVCGGGRPSDQPRGWFVEPTVLADVDSQMRIAQDEIFGPVVVVIPYADEDEAVRIANDSDYGLGGAVFSSDPERALAIARQVDSGFVSINRYGIPSSAPFGGVKRSGFGREHGVEGYDSFLEYTAHPIPHELALKLAAGLS